MKPTKNIDLTIPALMVILLIIMGIFGCTTPTKLNKADKVVDKVYMLYKVLR